MQTTLEDKLKYLRLSAIQQSLAARNQYALDHQLSYLEFFEMLVECTYPNPSDNLTIILR
jgi:hypothetical protein